jgi:hypothetical protein
MSNEYISNNPNIRLNILRRATDKFAGYIAGLGGNNSLYHFTVDKELKALLAPGEDALNQRNTSEEQKEERALANFLNVILDTSSGAYLTKEYLSNASIYGNPAILAKTKNTDESFSRLLGSSFKILSQKRFFGSIPEPQQTMLLISDEGSYKGVAASSIESFQDVGQTPTYTPPDENYGNTTDLSESEKKELAKQKKLKAIKTKYPWNKFKELKSEDQSAYAASQDLKLKDIKVYLKKEYEKDKINKDSAAALYKQRKKDQATRVDSTVPADIESFLFEIDSSGKTLNSLPIHNKSAGNSQNNNFSMNAYVFCNQNIQRASRNKDFLNVFFNAIPPLEMSRCTPFLDITIYHKNSSKNNKKFMNHEYHMRFLKQGKDGSFILDDSSLTNAKRNNAAARESSLDASFMNVFTSPQTMANANVNKSNSLFSKEKIQSADQGVLEPIVPLLSLSSFQVTIDGMGFGMVSSRKGSMSLVLHDRSRLTDFAPLVSLNQLSSTSMRVEFGWSHPDGDPIKSSNEIGKFLNAMRDVQFYNLTGTNLSFNNNSVNIEVQLASAGFELMTGVSASAGYYSPLNFINKKINKLIDDIITKEAQNNGEGNAEKQEGVLKKLKIIRTAATSQTAVVKTEDYRKVLALIENKNATPVKKLALIVSLLNFQSSASNEELESIDDIDLLLEVLMDYQPTEQNRFIAKLIKDKLAVAEITPDFDFSETTRTGYQLKLGEQSGKKVDEDIVLTELGLRYKQTITFGKLVLLYCALPMMSTCEFEDVQVFFYPINNKAGGARRFTTASLPMEYSIIRSAIDERFKNEGNISVKGMFSLLANLFDDTSQPVYGIGSFDYDKITSSKSKEDIKKEKEKAINDYKEKNKKKPSPEEEAENKPNKELTDKQKEAIYKHFLKKQFRSEIKSKLESLYKNDGLPMTETDSIVTPNLQMHMEVLPVIDPTVSTKGSSSVDDFFFGAAKKSNDDGYIDDKKILRIHVYDTRSDGNAAGELMNKILNTEVSDYYVGKLPSGVGANIANKEKDIETKGSKLISKIPTRELKYFVKRHYPNVTWGANSSIVKKLSISSNTTDKVSQLIMIRRKADERAAGGSKNRLSPEEEISINPSSISLEIFGCPFIDRGTQIFVDTGTGTDLDNVYTVNNITHTVRSGEYLTSLTLALTAQGAISSTRRKLAKKLKIAAKSIKKNT